MAFKTQTYVQIIPTKELNSTLLTWAETLGYAREQHADLSVFMEL